MTSANDLRDELLEETDRRIDRDAELWREIKNLQERASDMTSIQRQVKVLEEKVKRLENGVIWRIKI